MLETDLALAVMAEALAKSADYRVLQRLVLLTPTTSDSFPGRVCALARSSAVPYGVIEGAMKMRSRKRRTELANDLLLRSVPRDRLRTIRTDIQSISTVGRYRARSIRWPATLYFSTLGKSCEASCREAGHASHAVQISCARSWMIRHAGVRGQRDMIVYWRWSNGSRRR
jgi:hypothetical protein